MKGQPYPYGAVCVFTVGVMCGFSTPGYASGYVVVDSLADPGVPADGLTTLGEAITEANNLGGATIVFSAKLAGGTIHVLGALPDLTGGSTVIDGDINHDYIPDIELDGSFASGSGITISSSNNVLRGLVINRFSWFGVNIEGPGSDGNRMIGCYIGVTISGLSSAGNGLGIRVWTSSETTIGPYTLVSGNVNCEIAIERGESVAVDSCRVGTDATGRSVLGPNVVGVWIRDQSNRCVVRNCLLSGNSDAIVIDGGSQHALISNLVGLDITGTAPLPNMTGIWLRSGVAETVVGPYNVIGGNPSMGILLSGGAHHNTVDRNYIGTDRYGATGIANGTGVILSSGAHDNIIGPGNTISGNTNTGVWISDLGTDANQVIGNFCGTVSTGNLAIANGAQGVGLANGASDNIIGTGNVISGNGYAGVTVGGSGTNRNRVTGNLIGTDVAGASAIQNNGPGTVVSGDAADNTIGPGNLVSGNNSEGVVLDDGAHNNRVLGNKIGTDVTGIRAIPNYWSGVLIQLGGHHNTIGGMGPGEGNLCSGNRANGITIRDAGSDENQVIGNTCGVDVMGTSPLPNGYQGVRINTAASGNIIGPGNIISGNARDGVGIDDNAVQNTVTGNQIGLGVSGVLSNGRHGVCLWTGASGNAIGPDNVIAWNAGTGVGLNDGTTVRNTITRNRIFSNIGLGIDLDLDDRTLNDPNDLDAGANGRQNYPVLLRAWSDGDTIRIEGMLNSAPGRAYQLEFSADAGDPSGFGEGQTCLGDLGVTTDASGNAAFTAGFTATLPDCSVVSATATDGEGNTSEFSAHVALDDADADGTSDACDNCPTTANQNQRNADQDELGDLCDNCPAITNPAQEDLDQDFVGEVCDSCPGTPAGWRVDLSGCPLPVPGDFDRDGDVDQEDYGRFQACLSGTGVSQDEPACQDAKFDGDIDVDPADAAMFQGCMSGPNVPGNQNCAM